MDEEINTCSWYEPSCALAWMSGEFQALALWFYDSILSGLASALESIPVPDFLANVSSVVIPESVSWAANFFQIELGATIIVSAYTARFILRRIPGIG